MFAIVAVCAARRSFSLLYRSANTPPKSDITAQAATLIHTSVVAHPTGMIRLAERLAALVPYLDEAQVFFCNSGAEAVDGSLKLARKVTGKPGVTVYVSNGIGQSGFLQTDLSGKPVRDVPFSG